MPDRFEMPASQQKERVKKTITRHQKTKKKKSEEGGHYEKHRDWQRQSL
jgi:hypothetical protein